MYLPVLPHDAGGDRLARDRKDKPEAPGRRDARRKRADARAETGDSQTGLEELEPRILLSTFTVTNTDDAGEGSLRQAILDANAQAGADVIEFHIESADANHFFLANDGSGDPGTETPTTSEDDSSIANTDPDDPSGFHSYFSIRLSSVLPELTDVVTIDARTQAQYDGTPAIEIDGSLVSGAGLRFIAGSGGSSVYGLAINRFGGDGMELEGAGSITIEGNYLGTDITGTLGRGNAGDGINIQGSDGNTILRNLISGNTDDGISLTDGSGANVVRGNLIGTDVTGTAPIGNGDDGISIEGDTGSGDDTTTGNMIGGASAPDANTIAFNTGNGITVVGDGTTGNTIRRNSIANNAGQAIDLGDDGPDGSDAFDSDPGPNLLTNAPTITTAQSSGTQIDFAANFTGQSATTYTFDFYVSGTNGEARRWVGSHVDTTTAGGTLIINSNFAVAAVPGEFLTATATDPSGNTSEVGVGLVLSMAAGAAPMIDLDLDDSSGIPGSDYQATWTEGGGYVALVGADATLFVEGPTLDSLVVTLANFNDSADALWMFDTTGTSIVGSVLGNVLTLSGTDSVANYEAVLRTIAWDNASQNPDPITRRFEFVADDGTATGPVAVTNLIAKPLNDAPVNTVPGSQVTPLDTPVIFSSGGGTLISLSDVDADPADELELTLSVNDGTLSLNTLVPIAGETLVNTTTSGGQVSPSIAFDAAGHSVIVFQDASVDAGDIRAQRYDTSGNPVGVEFVINATTANEQQSPIVSMAPDGRFVVVWESYKQDQGNTWGSYARVYDASGNPTTGEIRINTTKGGDQRRPEVFMNDDGSFAVAWEGNGPGDADGIFFQRFDASGNLVGGETLVNGSTGFYQAGPVISGDGSGNYFVAWRSTGQDGSGEGVYGQRFDVSGAKVGSEFRLSTTTTGNQTAPSVAYAPDGSSLAVWTDDGLDGDFSGVFGQRYDAAGVAQGAEFLINEVTAGGQFAPHVSFARRLRSRIARS